MNLNTKNRLFIYSALFIALTIDAFNFSSGFQFIKPSAVLLVLVYWNMALPDKVGITTALFFGMLVDFLEGSLLGIHPMLFVFITYLCQRFFYQFRVIPFWQQSFLIFIICFLSKLALALDFLNSDLGKSNMSDSSYLLTAFIYGIISAFAWPLVYFICRNFRRRFIKI